MLPYDVGPSSVPPFTYVWTNAVTGVVMRVDSLGSSQYNGPPSHVATYTNRCAGFYTLQVYDYYGNSLPPIDFTVNQPDSIFVDLGFLKNIVFKNMHPALGQKTRNLCKNTAGRPKFLYSQV